YLSSFSILSAFNGNISFNCSTLKFFSHHLPISFSRVSNLTFFKPKSITPHTDFEAEVYILNKDEGGRHTPFFNNYRPQFYVRTT
ncbi:hypothetical protein VWM73_12190, partial [Campylobacter coli]